MKQSILVTMPEHILAQEDLKKGGMNDNPKEVPQEVVKEIPTESTSLERGEDTVDDSHINDNTNIVINASLNNANATDNLNLDVGYNTKNKSHSNIYPATS